MDENSQNIDIIVNETQTGSFNVGLSIGTLEGASFVSGLKENNINGTGRTLEFLINTNEDNKEFTLSTEDKFFINNEINHGYSVKYKENDFSKSTFDLYKTFKIEASEITQLDDYFLEYFIRLLKRLKDINFEDIQKQLKKIIHKRLRQHKIVH